MHAQQAMLHAQAVGDESLVADAHRALAWVLPRDEHEPNHLASAVAQLRRHGARRHESALYSNLAHRATIAGRYDEALELATAAVSLATEDRRAAAKALANLGFAQLFTGHLAEAADTFVHQLQIVREQVAPMQAAVGLAGLAAVAAANGDHERCAVLLGAAEHFGSGGQLTAQAELHRRFYQGAAAALGSTAWRAGVQAGAQLDFAAAIEATTRLATPRAGGREGVT